MIFEKKLFTNVYYSKPKKDIVAIGMYSNEKSAESKILTDDENFTFKGTVPATLRFEYGGENKETGEDK